MGLACLLAVLSVLYFGSVGASAVGSCSLAGVKTWKATAADNNWFNPNNWSPGGVPAGSTHVCIQSAPPGGFVSIGTGSTAAAASLETDQPIKVTAGGLTLSSTTQPSNVNSGATFELAGGTLGGAGALTVNGALNWTGGSEMSGAGSTTIGSGGTLAINAATDTFDRFLTTRTLTVDPGASATWSGNAPLFSDSDGDIDVGGTLEIQNANTLSSSFGTAGSLHVLAGGTLKKSAGATSNVDVPFENDGAVQVDTRTLNLEEGTGAASVASAGTWKATSPGVVRFTAGIHKLDGFHQLAGSGRVEIVAGEAQFTMPGTVDAGATLELESGTLGGAGALTVNGALNWTGGSEMSGAGSTTIGSGGTLAINAATDTFDRGLATRTLTVDPGASATWSGNAPLYSLSDGDIDVGGTLEIQNANVLSDIVGTAGSLRVLAGGTLKKSAGATSNVDVAFENDGTADVSAGKLQLTGTFANYAAGAFRLTGGTFMVRNGAVFQFPGADVRNNSSDIVLDGAGSKLFDGGADGLRNFGNNEAAGRFELKGGRNFARTGAFTNNGTVEIGSASKLSATGAYTQGAGGTLGAAIAGTAPGSSYGQLAPGTTATLAGTLDVDSSGHDPSPGQFFDIVTAATRTGTFSTVNGAGDYDVNYLANRVRLTSKNDPFVYSDDASVQEGGTGATTPVSTKIRLSEPSPDPVTVAYSSVQNTATGGVDYTGKAASVTFAPGEVEKPAGPFNVKGDTLKEGVENFQVKLTSIPSANASFGDQIGLVHIRDEEGRLFATIDDLANFEGDSGSADFAFKVKLSEAPAPGQTVSVKYATADGSATLAGGDYGSTTGTLTFTSATGPEQTVNVPVNGDATVEAAETFKLKLNTPKGLTVSDLEGSGTIFNDD